MTECTDSFAEITWEADGSPRSLHFDDPYFARDDGRAETRHVFLAGNDLPRRWQSEQHFTIAELGFGTGLNFFETLAQWRQAPGACAQLTFVSFERYPMTGADMARAIQPWPDLAQCADALLAHWPPPAAARVHTITIGQATLEVHLGDANCAVAAWDGAADAWYLDGFSPAKNAELWNGALMAAVYARTRAGGTFATYTAAGFVRRNLADAGFEVRKIPGFGRKRESLAGRRAK